jgi:pimeloyl-ACP methyl ester carboxylesterase
MSGFFRFLGALLLLLIAVVVVGYLALRRPDIAYDTLKAKYANAASRYLALSNGVVVHYRDQGDKGAPALVMVHGFSASLIDWEPWVQRLDHSYRIITLDLPGHGLTSAPVGFKPGVDVDVAVVDEVASRLGAAHFVLIGNSMGGGVAWNYAVLHPDKLNGLVLVDAAGWPRQSQDGGGPIIFKILRYPAGRALLRGIDTSPLIEQGLKSAFVDPKLVTPAMVTRYGELARAPGHRDLLLQMQTRSGSGPTVADLARLQVPTLVMHGEDDRVIPFADGQAFARTIPGATLIAYPGVGHVPMEQIPDRSAADLDHWLKTKVYLPAPPAAPPVVADPGAAPGTADASAIPPLPTTPPAAASATTD